MYTPRDVNIILSILYNWSQKMINKYFDDWEKYMRGKLFCRNIDIHEGLFISRMGKIISILYMLDLHIILSSS